MEALQNLIAELSSVDYIIIGLLAIFMIVSIISIIVAGNRQKAIYVMEDKLEDAENKYSELKETANTKLKEKNSLIKDLKAEIDDLNNSVGVTGNSEEIEELKAALENKDNEIKKISRQYEDKIITLQAEQGEVIIDQTELTSTKQELEDLKKELAEQVVKCAEYETLIEELKQDATSARQAAADAAKATKPKATPKPKKEKVIGTEVDYNKYTKSELLSMCISASIATSPKMSKSDMIILLQDYNKSKKVN